MIPKTRLERWAPATFAIAVFFIVALLVGSRFFASSTHAQMQLQITEIMPDNRTAFADDDGLFYDWAEITNLGAEAVDLSNFSLTDDTSKPNCYSFPRKTLNPNESVVVFLTGKNKENREFYAPFSLDNDGETLYLYANKEPISSLSVPACEPDRSFGFLNNEKVWFATPTPGNPNEGIAASTLTELYDAVYTGITINEVCAVSSSKEESNPYDWIELHNTTDEEISLHGYRLTENLTETGLVFENISLIPNEYLVIYCDKNFTPSSGMICAPFSLDSNGDEVYLVAPNGTVTDSFSTGKQRFGVTSGRSGNDRTTRVFFETPTPATPNGKPLLGYTTAPIVSHTGGYTNGSFLLSLTVPKNASVHYTFDGSTPTKQSPLYTPDTVFAVESTTVFRAVAFQDGYLPSDVVTQTYFTEAEHTLPVVSVTTDPSLLFGPEGAWTNFKDDTLRPTVHTEYFAAGGTKELEFDSSFHIAGGYTRSNVQKAFSLNLSQATGDTEIVYPFFKDSDVSVFDHLLLRPSGSDWNKAKLRDEFCAQALKNTDGQLIQSAQPVALYINGQYYGLYYLREKRNEDFIASYTDIPVQNVQLTHHPNLTRNDEPVHPNLAALINYAKTHDLRKAEHYDYVMSQIDATSLMQFFTYQTFFGNGDCVNNTGCYRDATGGKWKWIIYDMDWACSPNYQDFNFLQQLKDGTPKPDLRIYHYPLFTALLKNEQFREEFLLTYARLMQTTLKAERLTVFLDQLATEIEGEIERQHNRFDAPSVNTWNYHIAFMHTFIQNREAVMTKQLKSVFSVSDAEWDDLYKRALHDN